MDTGWLSPSSSFRAVPGRSHMGFGKCRVVENSLLRNFVTAVSPSSHGAWPHSRRGKQDQTRF